MKKISIIVPVYNVEQFLPKCIDSIMNQTYKNLEIILVDDGSPDNCPSICDEYAQKDERVKVIHKKNGGLSSARNAGLDLASGEYVCFFDSDDFVESDMIERMIDSSIDDVDVFICGYSVDFYNEKGEQTHASQIFPLDLVHNNLSLNKYEYMLGVCGYAWNKLYKRQFLINNTIRFEEGVSLVEDLLFNSKVFFYNANFKFIRYIGYHYIQRDRVTLGVKYYENFFDLKQKAIDAKIVILKKWALNDKLVKTFYNNNFVESVWATIKNINNSNLSTLEKQEKIKEFLINNEIKKNLKTIKPKAIKVFIKKLLLTFFSVKLLLKFIK